MSTDSQPTNQQLSPSLDSNGDNPTRWEKGLSESETADSDSGGEPDPDNWGRQQKRVFHRVNTLLHYWESHGYQIVWVTLTSCPESDPAGELAYNVQRLRQTIERAKLAKGGDGTAHSLSHITELEQLAIRTSEGPEGKGVVHLFWAWKPPEGNHSRRLYIPQDWLANQWGRVHGPYDEHSEEPVEPLYVWIEEYGKEDYHDRKSVARYCVTQYLGEHAEALEHVSWSHGRTLGGSLKQAWDAIRSHRESLSEVIEVWERVIAGDSVELGSKSDNVDYSITVEPPPELGVKVIEDISVSPPESYQQFGPDVMTVRTVALSVPEFEGYPDDRKCPMCDSATGIHELPSDHSRRDRDQTDRVAFVCVACKSEFARPGDGGPVEVVREMPEWDAPETPQHRQARLYEFPGFGRCKIPEPRSAPTETDTGRSVSVLTVMSRERTNDSMEFEDTNTLKSRVRVCLERLGLSCDPSNTSTVAGRLLESPEEVARVLTGDMVLAGTESRKTVSTTGGERDGRN